MLQAGFAGPQRRTSFVGILHQMSAQNRLLFNQRRVSSTSDAAAAAAADSPPPTDDDGDDDDEEEAAARRRTSDDGASCVSVAAHIDDNTATSLTITGSRPVRGDRFWTGSRNMAAATLHVTSHFRSRYRSRDPAAGQTTTN